LSSRIVADGYSAYASAAALDSISPIASLKGTRSAQQDQVAARIFGERGRLYNSFPVR
jgi:hypothetical protein